MIWHFSTSPYFSNMRVTSCSVKRGWMPVTKRLEPGLMAPSSSRSPPREPVSSLAPLERETVHVSNRILSKGESSKFCVCLPVAVAITVARGRSRATTSRVSVITRRARGGAAVVALVTRSLVCVALVCQRLVVLGGAVCVEKKRTIVAVAVGGLVIHSGGSHNDLVNKRVVVR